VEAVGLEPTSGTRRRKGLHAQRPEGAMS